MRRSGAALTGATRALLPPRLATAAGDLAAFLGFVGAPARVRELTDKGLMHDSLIDRCSEDIVAQLNLADLFSGHVVNWY
jgi:hypothetical protein